MNVHDQRDYTQHDDRSHEDQPFWVQIRSEAFGNQAAHHATGKRSSADSTEGSRRLTFISVFENVVGQEPQTRKQQSENGRNKDENG